MMIVKTATAAQALQAYLPAWTCLAAAAVDPNPFYEPWFLLPALTRLDEKKPLLFVLVFNRTADADQLCGFFPLQLRRTYRGLPLRCATLWCNDYCFLCTPLVRQGFVSETMDAFLDWLAGSSPPCHVAEFALISGAGAPYDCLTDWPRRRHAATFTSCAHERAVFYGCAGVRGRLSGKHEKSFRRAEKDLAARGCLAYQASPGAADLPAWTDAFLALEAGGWKGREGTAMACHPAEADFFREIIAAAHRQERLFMSALRLDDEFLAMRCCFRSGRGLFLFKVAFAEAYAKYSPGTLLERYAMRELADSPLVDWTDSCASDGQPLWNRLWEGRKQMLNLTFALHPGLPEAVVASLPYLQRVYLRVGALARSGAPFTPSSARD